MISLRKVSFSIHFMTKLFSSILLRQNEVSRRVSNGDGKDASIWHTSSTISTNTLINPLQPKFLPQLLASVLSCWVCLASGASLGYFTSALKSLQGPDSRLPISDGQGSWIASLVMLGAMCGGLLSGPCISLGRRRALWLVAVPLTLAWIIIATAHNVILLYVAHSLFGICLGIVTDASQIYVSESVSAQWRGTLGCVPTLMFNIGMLLCYLAGNWLDWEETAVFGSILTLPALLVPLAFPESPSYLVAKGRMEEAKAALHSLRGVHWDISAEFDELLHCEKGASLIERLRGLGSIEMLKPLALTGAVRALSRFCGLRAILSYIQIILLHSVSSINIKLATISTGVVQLLATVGACFLVDRLGRRKLLIASQIVMGASLVTLGCYLYYKPDTTISNGLGWLPITAILVFIIAYSMGLGPVSGILIGELIPQRHRSIASSITGALSWLSAFIVTKTFLDLQSSLQLYGVMWLYGGVCIAGIVFVFFCLPETRGISQYGIDVLFSKKTTAKEKASEKMGV